MSNVVKETICICDFKSNQRITNVLSIIIAVLQILFSVFIIKNDLKKHYFNKDILSNTLLGFSIVMLISAVITIFTSVSSINTEIDGINKLKSMYCNGNSVEKNEKDKCYAKDTQKLANVTSMINSAYLLSISFIFVGHFILSNKFPIRQHPTFYIVYTVFILSLIYSFVQTYYLL